MDAINYKKILGITIASFAALAFLLIVPAAKADDENTVEMHGAGPKITDISDIRATSAVINFRSHGHKFRNQTVTAIISIKNESTEILKERAARIMLNDNGEGSVRVTKLLPGTDYSFKVRILESGETNESTRNSEDKDITTAFSNSSSIINPSVSADSPN